MAIGQVENDSADLSRTHHAVEILLREDALQGYDIGSIFGEQGFQPFTDCTYSARQLGIGRALQHTNRKQGYRSTRFARNETESAARQSGVNPENLQKLIVLEFGKSLGG